MLPTCREFNWSARDCRTTKLPASQQSVMSLSSKQDRETSGKSRTQADLSHLDRRMTPGCSQQQGAFIMCDYSLDFVVSRPARVGDKLVSTRFRNSVTRGFAAIGEPNVAVCLLPGTEIQTSARVSTQRCFSCLHSQRSRPRQMLRTTLPTWNDKFETEGCLTKRPAFHAPACDPARLGTR